MPRGRPATTRPWPRGGSGGSRRGRRAGRRAPAGGAAAAAVRRPRCTSARRPGRSPGRRGSRAGRDAGTGRPTGPGSARCRPTEHDGTSRDGVGVLRDVQGVGRESRGSVGLAGDRQGGIAGAGAPGSGARPPSTGSSLSSNSSRWNRHFAPIGASLVPPDPCRARIAGARLRLRRGRHHGRGGSLPRPQPLAPPKLTGEIEPSPMALPLAEPTPLHSRESDKSHLAPHRIKRCTYRRLISLDRPTERLYEVECLYPDRKVPIPLGDLDTSLPICNACTAPHTSARTRTSRSSPARRPVSRVLYRGLRRGDGHPSGAAGCPTAHAADPRAGQRASPPGEPGLRPPIWPCSGWSLPRFTPAPRGRHRHCGTGPRLTADGRYPPPCAGELGLSSRRPVARPTRDHPAASLAREVYARPAERATRLEQRGRCRRPVSRSRPVPVSISNRGSASRMVTTSCSWAITASSQAFMVSADHLGHRGGCRR